MEIRNLPIPYNPYSTPSRDNRTGSPAAGDKNQETFTRQVNKSAETSPQNNQTQPALHANLQVVLQRQYDHSRHEGLHNTSMSYQARQAINSYQQVNENDRELDSGEILNRVDTLA